MTHLPPIGFRNSPNKPWGGAATRGTPASRVTRAAPRPSTAPARGPLRGAPAASGGRSRTCRCRGCQQRLSGGGGAGGTRAKLNTPETCGKSDIPHHRGTSVGHFEAAHDFTIPGIPNFGFLLFFFRRCGGKHRGNRSGPRGKCLGCRLCPMEPAPCTAAEAVCAPFRTTNPGGENAFEDSRKKNRKTMTQQIPLIHSSKADVPKK